MLNEGMLQNNGFSISPININSSDPGDETQKRFRYQHTFTALVAIKMLSGEVPYKELYCEHHEDILAVEGIGKYHGIQIKTRQLKDGPFELDDPAIKGSLLRFIQHNINYPGSFVKFVIVSNCPCRDDETGKSLLNLLAQVKSGTIENFTPKTLDKFILEVAKDSETGIDIVLDVLKKTDYLAGPGLDDIDSKVISEHLGKLPECMSVGIEKLRVLHRRICEKMHQASSKLLDNAVKDYAALAGGQSIINAEEINSKRITKQMLSKLVSENISTNLFLSSRLGISELSQSNSSQLMKFKMASGLIDNDVIEMVDDFRADAEEYFLVQSYKAENKDNSIRELNQIRKIVLNESRESKSRLKKENVPYGSDMLHEIENRLREVSKTRSKDVFECPYEILKGIVGILTNECKIEYSKVPEGGWRNNVSLTD
ncbi:hypothetical protein BK120_08820 [Paenibacillus sp. FSL A5-0031]|uniref:dsDNA nuclease domain-containing protein n=1 Tax=Paenibacillus sp. FSL A5-0031 TaxID=1920420 RepID=UPI00096C8A7A|nr:dsDNA nuclease domain-containing protein [Paenibacillus sp. FSL A5-0031]OME86083.1 hypothetical protein BK120_08820 [Paenibacillus sp. FSL A5-0031]